MPIIIARRPLKGLVTYHIREVGLADNNNKLYYIPLGGGTRKNAFSAIV